MTPAEPDPAGAAKAGLVRPVARHNPGLSTLLLPLPGASPMIALQKAAAYIELEDYLVLEAASRYRHEYLDGVIYAVQGESVRGMAGGSAAHADLIRNIGFALHARLRGSPCGVKMSEMRLRIDAVDAVFYPDVLVHCQPLARPADITELTEARVVVEVLSPTTQTFDRGAKRAAYQRLPGLRQVVLVSSTEPAAWSMQRDDDAAEWSALQPWPAGTPLAVPSLALDLPWDEVYGGVGLG